MFTHSKWQKLECKGSFLVLQKSMGLQILLERLLKRHLPERYANRF